LGTYHRLPRVGGAGRLVNHRRPGVMSRTLLKDKLFHSLKEQL